MDLGKCGARTAAWWVVSKDLGGFVPLSPSRSPPSRGAGRPCAREQTAPSAWARGPTGSVLSPDIVRNKMVHFDLLHEDVSLQYFIPALS